MKELISSIVSLVLLVPVIYFLPIEFSKKGKGLLVLTAFIFANLAFIAKLSFSLWQITLIMLLLITITAYFIDKKIGRVVYGTSMNSENKDELENLDIPVQPQKFSEIMEEQEVEGGMVQDSDIVQKAGMELLSINNETEPVQQNDHTSLLIDDALLEMEEIKIIPEENSLNIQEIEQEIEDSTIDDEAAFLYSREATMDDLNNEENAAFVDEKDNESIVKMDYMHEIENLLQSEDRDDFQTLDDPDNETDLNEIYSIEEENTEQDKSLTMQQQVFSTIVRQLQIARKQMKSHEYESLIKDHLHEGLTAHDYYTLSSLLIEHFVINKETEKLKDLLFILKEKFNQYPILAMEIQYLSNRYGKN